MMEIPEGLGGKIFKGCGCVSIGIVLMFILIIVIGICYDDEETDEKKEEVRSLANFVKIQKQREAKGLKTPKMSFHLVFTGSPGTGKTTVARIVARIYKDLGVLKKGHLVETDRSGLVANYVGQTATKTNEIVDSALNGVLFIDEAYALVPTANKNNDYGQEAISTLLKRMEDDRDKLVVIVAGYTKEMNRFIDSNPGLKSRFNRYINFPDYTSGELIRPMQSAISRRVSIVPCVIRIVTSVMPAMPATSSRRAFSAKPTDSLRRRTRQPNNCQNSPQATSAKRLSNISCLFSY